jgi:hypothetical protein
VPRILDREDVMNESETACEEAFDFLYAKLYSYGYNTMYVDFPLKVENLSAYFRVKRVGLPTEAESQTFPGLPSGKHVYQISWD